jgi:hypothetical protein
MTIFVSTLFSIKLTGFIYKLANNQQSADFLPLQLADFPLRIFSLHSWRIFHFQAASYVLLLILLLLAL